MELLFLDNHILIRILSFLGMVLLGVIFIPVIVFFIFKWSIRFKKKEESN